MKMVAREVICPECNKKVKKVIHREPVGNGMTFKDAKVEKIFYHCHRCGFQKWYEGKSAQRMMEEEPSIDQLEAWLFDGVCEATDGCMVEPDGYCPHGCPSWLIKVGIH